VRAGHYVVRDSGERKVFASGMQRDTDEGKIKWSLVADGPMLRRWAEHLTKGAVKYDDKNWMKADGPEELERFKESAFRHFMAWYYGDKDGEDHAAGIYYNVNGAEYVNGGQEEEETVYSELAEAMLDDPTFEEPTPVPPLDLGYPRA